MPFKSKAQRGYLFVHEPKVAKEFAAKTPKGAKLPEHVKKKPMPKKGGRYNNIRVESDDQGSGYL